MYVQVQIKSSKTSKSDWKLNRADMVGKPMYQNKGSSLSEWEVEASPGGRLRMKISWAFAPFHTDQDHVQG